MKVMESNSESSLMKSEFDNSREIVSEVKEKYVMKIIWGRVLTFSVIHLSAIYGAYLCLTSGKLETFVFGESTILIKCF